MTELSSLDVEAYRLFFVTIPPWNCDKMGCVWRHVSNKVECLYSGVCGGLTNLMKSADLILDSVLTCFLGLYNLYIVRSIIVFHRSRISLVEAQTHLSQSDRTLSIAFCTLFLYSVTEWC
jgi:ribosomal protein S27E